MFVCDAPARSYIQCIKGHTGYHGCGYCKQIGQYVQQRMTFPGIHFEMRSDDLYEQMAESYQLSASPFSGIAPLMKGFPPEYMHSVCLGVVRKLFHYYFTPTKGINLPCRLSVFQKS